jgi:single-stranded DNA-binding protein
MQKPTVLSLGAVIMQSLNRQTVAGNLADDAVIRSITESRDALSMRIISNERWIDNAGNEQTRSCGHDVVRYGARGSFDEFAQKSLKKGSPVFAIGRVDRESNTAGNEVYRNVVINTSAEGGVLSPLDASMQVNAHEIAGFLIQDSELRDAGKGKSCLSFVVATTVVEYYNNERHEFKALHPIVKFEKTAKLQKLAEKLKTGAGVYFTGKAEKNRSEAGDKVYHNATVNVSESPLRIFRYVTEKTESRPNPQQQAA